MAQAPDRVVDVRTRTVLRVLWIIIGVAILLAVIWIARRVVTWVLIALFLALALDPLVNFIQRRGRVKRHRRSRSRSRFS